MTNSDHKKRIAQMWRDYKSNPTERGQQRIVEQYRPLVYKIASNFLQKKPNVLDYDDLLSAGMMGLLDAIEKFDPDNEKKAQFQTYATFRVNGAILDEINSMDWTPRSVRQDIKNVINSIEQHYKQSSEGPSVEEISSVAGLGKERVREVLHQMNKTFISQMEATTMEGALAATDQVEDNGFSDSVSFAIRQVLDKTEEQYVLLKFYYGYSNAEIQKHLHLKANELKTLRVKAFQKLQVALAEPPADK